MTATDCPERFHVGRKSTETGSAPDGFTSTPAGWLATVHPSNTYGFASSADHTTFPSASRICMADWSLPC